MSQDIRVVGQLGEGTFGVVMKIKRGERNSTFAMKVFKNEVVDKEEVKVLKKMHHLHIVQYRDFIVYDHKNAIVMEYCDGGDLKEYLASREHPLREKLVWEWFSQLSIAMQYFHGLGIIHRDIKPANILLHDGELKISDFGLASMMNQMVSHMTTQVGRGTPMYMAPELFDAGHFGPKSDIWSLGCIVYEMCTLTPAFTTIAGILIRPLAPIQDSFSSTLKRVVEGMLLKSPDQRHCMADIMNLCEVRQHIPDALINEDELSSRLSTSTVAACPSTFPNPYSDETRANVDKTNLSYWQKFCLKLVPFLCDENGEYFVNWDNIDEQWKFGNLGKNCWSLDFRVQCSLLLPRQFNVNGWNDRVVILVLRNIGKLFTIEMTHLYSPSANVKLTTLNCQFHLSFKHNDETSWTELRDTIQCQVTNADYGLVFESSKLPFSSFSKSVPPSLRLTLMPL